MFYHECLFDTTVILPDCPASSGQSPAMPRRRPIYRVICDTFAQVFETKNSKFVIFFNSIPRKELAIWLARKMPFFSTRMRK